jgi:hypothetical protein
VGIGPGLVLRSRIAWTWARACVRFSSSRARVCARFACQAAARHRSEQGIAARQCPIAGPFFLGFALRSAFANAVSMTATSASRRKGFVMHATAPAS